MPRISRTDVEFPVLHDSGSSQVWLARFTHQHDDLVGVPFSESGKPIFVRHITRCKLSRKGAAIFVTGVSMCSLKDTYDWRKGIKRAFQKALERAGFCEQIKEKEGRFHIASGRHFKQHSFMPLKLEYDEAMASFFRELPIKSYWPHNKLIEAKSGEIISDVPVENRMGLGYAGAD